VRNDDAGKIGATLAIISQMAATNGNSATEVIGVLKAAIKNQTLSMTVLSPELVSAN
jgi:hypothetical protein